MIELEERLFKAERMHRDRMFQRDRAERAATKTLTELRAVRNLPRWPPVSLTVTPAALPTTPVSPRKGQIATGVLVVSGLLTWGIVLYLHRRRRK